MVPAVNTAQLHFTPITSPKPTPGNSPAPSSTSTSRRRKRQRRSKAEDATTAKSLPSPSPRSRLNPDAAPFVPVQEIDRCVITRFLDDACHSLAAADLSINQWSEQAHESLSLLRRDLRSLRAQLDHYNVLEPQTLTWDFAEGRPSSPAQRVLDNHIRPATADLDWLFPPTDDTEDEDQRVDADLLAASNAKLQSLYPNECPRSPTISERYHARSRFYEIMEGVRPQVIAAKDGTHQASKPASKVEKSTQTDSKNSQAKPKEKVYDVKQVSFESILKRSL